MISQRRVLFLGNHLATPTFWLWSFKHKKAMRMIDPKHFDHILPFLQPADVHHAIPLTAQEVVRMHTKDDIFLLLWVPSTCSPTVINMRGSISRHPLLLLPHRRGAVPLALLRLSPLRNQRLHLFACQILGRVYRYGAKNL